MFCRTAELSCSMILHLPRMSLCTNFFDGDLKSLNSKHSNYWTIEKHKLLNVPEPQLECSVHNIRKTDYNHHFGLLQGVAHFETFWYVCKDLKVTPIIWCISIHAFIKRKTWSCYIYLLFKVDLIIANLSFLQQIYCSFSIMLANFGV
jgi:hypothetical protein